MSHSTVKHVRLTTANLQAMVGWYARVFGMSSSCSSTPNRAPTAAGLTAAWSSKGAATPCVTLLSISALPVEPRHSWQPQRLTLACATLADLLGACQRLKALGIEPVLTLERGVATTFVYEDPDGNVVELKLDNVDSEKMIAASAAAM